MAEVLAELEAATRHHGVKGGYYTVAEIAQAVGWGEKKVRTALMGMKLAGRLQVERAERENLANVKVQVIVYRILPAKKGRK